LDLEENSIEAGLTSASPFPSAHKDNLETSSGYLIYLRSGEPLPSMIIGDALEMNRSLRREYDADLKARKAFASQFGSASKRLLPFDKMFTPNEGWAIYLDHFLGTAIPVQENKSFRPPEGAATSGFAGLTTVNGGSNGDPLEYAIIALRSDAYPYQAKSELEEKFGLGDSEASEIVRIAKKKIMQNLEARNPEAWKSLGLSSYRSSEPEGNQYLDGLLEGGRRAGLDLEKLRETFENTTPERMRELTSFADDMITLERKANLQIILSNAAVFGLTEGYYVEHQGRIFFYSIAEDFWTQLFQRSVLSDAVRLAAQDIQNLLFERNGTHSPACTAQFVRLAQHAVQPSQIVQLKAKLPDGAEKTARLHAAKWAGLLLGFPVIVRDEAPGGVMEWHFNDYPGNATIYRVRDDDADPLELVHEVNWMHLQRKVLENRGRTETQAEHADLSEHELLHNPKGAWTVYVDDNFHYMDEDERYVLGTFDSYDTAVTACRKIVDNFLEANDAKSADEMFESYVSFGEDPWIKGRPTMLNQPNFSARKYAGERCTELWPQSS
jgi:hypothetical protein